MIFALGAMVNKVWLMDVGRFVFGLVYSGKGPSATGFSPISRYMEDFGGEKCARLSKVVCR